MDCAPFAGLDSCCAVACGACPTEEVSMDFNGEYQRGKNPAFINDERYWVLNRVNQDVEVDMPKMGALVKARLVEPAEGSPPTLYYNKDKKKWILETHTNLTFEMKDEVPE